MGWVNWSRKPAQDAKGEPVRLIGIDLNAGRARAAAERSAKNRLILLDDPQPELPLAISLERRTAEAGRIGLALRRRLPHLSITNFLPLLGQPHEWIGGRHRLDAIAALSVFMERLRGLCAPYEGVAFALPGYLGLAQVSKFVQVAQKARVKLNGTAGGALALAVDRAKDLLSDAGPIQSPPGWVVPMHRSLGNPPSATVVVLEADEHALTGTVVRIDTEQAKVLACTSWPRAGLKAWRDRILDALADRCIRLCRRDPRDSAEAEQALYDQIDEALDRIRHGQRVALSVRSTHWYQDLIHTPEEFEAFCTPLLRVAVDGVRDLASNPALAEPPRAVWLTHDAARLPGLLSAVHQHMSERTAVSVLPPDAIASAAASLSERWKTGELPHVHLDTS